MDDQLMMESARERYGQLVRDAETFRRALRARKLDRSSTLLKSLIIFLIAIA